MHLRDYITNSIKYWEPRRILYNLVLTLITLSCAIPELSSGFFTKAHMMPMVFFIFVLAAIANVLYCAAYPVDIFIQCSDFRENWLRFRWVLFMAGLAIASVLAWFYATSLFNPLGLW